MCSKFQNNLATLTTDHIEIPQIALSIFLFLFKEKGLKAVLDP